MSKITAVSLLTSRTHRESYAQVGDLVVIANGHDTNKIYSVRTGVAYDMSFALPAAPTGSQSGAGVVEGDVRYRVRWLDSNTDTMSLPGAEWSTTVTAAAMAINRPTPPARATHYIIERTTNGGRIFYPVNRSADAPNGTAVATTSIADNNSDGIIRNRESIPEVQASLPIRPRYLFTNRASIFALGRQKHVVSAYLTNGLSAVTAGSGFNSNLVGRDLAAIGDTDGKTYQVSAVGSATALTLAAVYAGSTGTKTIVIADRGDVVFWSDPFCAEHYGSLLGNGQRSNQLTIGDDGEQLISGVGLGPTGCLLAKRDRLFLLTYARNPHPVTGDGSLITVPVRRGACGPWALRYVNGWAYGIDYRGIWRMSGGGGAPEEIGGPLAHEWKRSHLNWTRMDYFHIGYDPSRREVHFFVCEGSDSYPKKSWVWSEDLQSWVGSRVWPLGVTCTVELPDQTGAQRMVAYLEASGSAPSVAWMYGIGTSFGVNPANTPVSGTVTSGGATSLGCTGANWASSMAGVAVKLTRALDSSTETQIVVSNTTSALVTTAWTGAVPTEGDTFELGVLEARYRTPRLDFGDGSRKKLVHEVWIWAKYKADCIPFKVRAYIDGSKTAWTDFETSDEDGVSYTAGKPDMVADPTVQRHRFRFPMQDKPVTDIALEIRSSAAGQPWEVLRIKVKWDWDPSERPPDK